MTLRSYGLLATAISALSLTAQPSLAASQPVRHAGDSCFLTSDWQGWKSPSPSVIYLRVRVNDVYRVDLTAPSYQLQTPYVHLTSIVRGSPWICSPIDLDLAVVDDHGIAREPLFVKAITKLTPEQVAAIPAQFRP